MQIHQVKCDKCGKAKSMRNPYGDNYELPSRWINVSHDWLVNKELCPHCIRLLKKHSKEFFNAK
jgi:hypothetical protein